MSKDSYDSFVRTFPSTELLCKLLRVPSYDILFERHFARIQRRVRRGNVLSVYGSDVEIARAFESGELTSRKGLGKREVLELNKNIYRQKHDLFKSVRSQFRSILIGSAMVAIREQTERPDWNGKARPEYIFKDGEFGTALVAYNDDLALIKPELRRELCRECIVALKTFPQHADVWWQYKIENDSVWLEPKELTEELKATMQKMYDEARAQSWLVTTDFYPGWEPDKSKDPPDDWTP